MSLEELDTNSCFHCFDLNPILEGEPMDIARTLDHEPIVAAGASDGERMDLAEELTPTSPPPSSPIPPISPNHSPTKPWIPEILQVEQAPPPAPNQQALPVPPPPINTDLPNDDVVSHRQGFPFSKQRTAQRLYKEQIRLTNFANKLSTILESAHENNAFAAGFHIFQDNKKTKWRVTLACWEHKYLQHKSYDLDDFETVPTFPASATPFTFTKYIHHGYRLFYSFLAPDATFLIGVSMLYDPIHKEELKQQVRTVIYNPILIVMALDDNDLSALAFHVAQMTTAIAACPVVTNDSLATTLPVMGAYSDYHCFLFFFLFLSTAYTPPLFHHLVQ